MAGDPTTNLKRCATSPHLDVKVDQGTLKYAGPGSGTVDVVTSSNVYRCLEDIDLCFSCGSGTPPWSCDKNANLLSAPAFNVRSQEKIEDIWACSDTPDQSGCLTRVYNCKNATDQSPCPCNPGNPDSTPPIAPDANAVIWSKTTLSDATYGVTELKAVGPGSGSLDCETVYFVTTPSIYKCIVETGECRSLP